MNNPKRLTMKELKDEKLFPRQSNIVTLQCSGTRRIEQINEYPGDGDELINAPVGVAQNDDQKAYTLTMLYSGVKGPLGLPNGPESA